METIKERLAIPPLFDWWGFKKEHVETEGLPDLFYYEFQTKVNLYFSDLYQPISPEIGIKYILLMQKKYLEDLIIDFQKVYPPKQRHPGNYFDDLCELELQRVQRDITEKENEERKDLEKIKSLINEINENPTLHLDRMESDINDRLKEFKLLSNEGLQTNSTKIKLQWKGAKNQLYNVLRQLKMDYELIGNSYNSIADFLIQNVTGFETNSKETIEKELKKKADLPKPKRIKITPGEAE